MRKYLLITFVAASLLSCTASRRITYLNIPVEKGGSFEPVNIDSVVAKYSGHDGVYLNLERTIEHFGTKDRSAGQFFVGGLGLDWSFCDIKKYRYVVLNPEASWLTHVEFWRKPNQLFIIIINPDGSIRRYSLTDLKKESKEGADVYRLIFPDIRRGSLVEVGHEHTYSAQKMNPPLHHYIALQFYIPCEKLSFSYAYPDWWQVMVKDTGPFSNTQYETSSEPKKRKAFLRYSATDIPAILSEPYSPYFKEVGKYLRFQVTSLSMGGIKIDRRLTFKKITEEVYKDLIKPGRDGDTRFAILGLAREVVRGDTTRYQRMQSVVNYVRDSMEITSKYGKANYRSVINKKKGGAWELTGLTQAMLDALSIPTSLLLIHSADDGYLDTAYVDYGQFSVPAVRAEVDGEYYVLFPCLKHLPFDHTPQFVQGQPALEIKADGEWDYWTVPHASREADRTRRDYRLTLSEDGNVRVEETATHRGIMAYVWREMLSDLTDTELEKTFEEFTTFSGGEVTLKTHEFQNLNKPSLPLIIRLNYDIANLLTVTPEEVIFHTGGLFAPISGSKNNFDPDYRQLPISIRADEQHDKNIEFSFPPNWHLTTALTGVSKENDFGSITSQYFIGDGELRVTQKIFLVHTFADREQYPALLELVGNHSLLHLPNLVFSVSDMAP